MCYYLIYMSCSKSGVREPGASGQIIKYNIKNK